VWAAEGRNQDVLRRFSGDLGPQRAALLAQVPADGGEWIHAVVAERAPQAVICLDPFHIVKWGTGALDKLRRLLPAELRAGGRDGPAATIKHTRWALVKNPADLSPAQRGTLAQIARDNGQLYRGYLMKEQLRQIFAADTTNGKALLAGLISWASHSKIPEFTALARTLKGFRPLIWNTLDHQLTNARAQGINTQLAALTTRARGFHSAAAFIAMANLTSGGLCPQLPGR
jgi:transposase